MWPWHGSTTFGTLADGATGSAAESRVSISKSVAKVSKPAYGRVLPFARHARRSVQPTATCQAQEALHGALAHKSGLCSDALSEAGSLVTAAMFGAPLRQLLARVRDLLDDIDEVLLELDPVRDHPAFARAAALHRRLESVQSQVPRQCREWLAR